MVSANCGGVCVCVWGGAGVLQDKNKQLLGGWVGVDMVTKHETSAD